jgi:hypothetical protein
MRRGCHPTASTVGSKARSVRLLLIPGILAMLLGDLDSTPRRVDTHSQAEGGLMLTSGFARWAALSGALFVALWVTAFLILGDTVESSDSDAAILAYFGDKDHRTREFIVLVLLLAASLPFIVFISVLRARLEYGEGGAGVWTMAAFAAGLVSSALWTVAATLYVLPSLQTYGNGGFQLDPDTFRLLNSAGFIAWFSAGTIMSILVLATSVLGTRTGVIPRWLSWLGFAVALSLLAAFLVIPVIVLLAWLFTVSIALVWRRDTSKAADVPTLRRAAEAL